MCQKYYYALLNILSVVHVFCFCIFFRQLLSYWSSLFPMCLHWLILFRYCIAFLWLSCHNREVQWCCSFVGKNWTIALQGFPNWSVDQVGPNQNYFFRSNQGLAFQSRPCSRGGFVSAIEVQFKLKVYKAMVFFLQFIWIIAENEICIQ